MVWTHCSPTTPIRSRGSEMPSDGPPASAEQARQIDCEPKQERTAHAIRRAERPGLLRGRQRDVPERDLAVVALQHQRPWSALVAVNRAARDAGDDLVVDDRRAVQHDCYPAADERDVV